MDRVGFHPKLRAWRCAECTAASVRSLVSWARMISAEDLLSTATIIPEHGRRVGDVRLNTSAAGRDDALDFNKLCSLTYTGSLNPVGARL